MCAGEEGVVLQVRRDVDGGVAAWRGDVSLLRGPAAQVRQDGGHGRYRVDDDGLRPKGGPWCGGALQGQAHRALC